MEIEELKHQEQACSCFPMPNSKFSILNSPPPLSSHEEKIFALCGQSPNQATNAGEPDILIFHFPYSIFELSFDGGLHRDGHNLKSQIKNGIWKMESPAQVENLFAGLRENSFLLR